VDIGRFPPPETSVHADPRRRSPVLSGEEPIPDLPACRQRLRSGALFFLGWNFSWGQLTRRREEKVYLYSSVVDQQQFNEMVTRDVLEGLLKGNSRPILSTFVDLVSTDEELLEELDDLVRRKRG